MVQFLFNGSDAARIAAFCHIFDFLWKRQAFLFHNAVVFDDVDRDIMINEPQRFQVNGVDGTFDLDDVFFSHLVAAGIFNNGNAAVELVQVQVLIDLHAPAGLNMVQHEAFTQSADI